jgi:hypothetical protein
MCAACESSLRYRQMPTPPPPEHARFQPGQSGNPGGKAKNARNRLTNGFLTRLADDFEAHGADAIVAAREKDPVGYIKAIASLMPKQVEQSQPLDDLTDAELVAGIALLRARLTGDAGEGAGAPTERTAVN